MSLRADSAKDNRAWGLEDQTLDLDDVRAQNSVSVQLARVHANAQASRLNQRLQAVGSLVCAAAMLMVVVWYGESTRQEPGKPVSTTAAAVSKLVPVSAAAAYALPTSSPSEPAATTPVGTKALWRPGEGPVAARDCMMQVESTILFRLIARESTSRGAYNLAVNREIKRLSLRHKLRLPHTLDLIASEVWAGRSDPVATPARWTAQSRHCELPRARGTHYVVLAN